MNPRYNHNSQYLLWELRRLEQDHHIPPLAPNLKAAVDELFKKELND
jgi:hypothetical protein